MCTDHTPTWLDLRFNTRAWRCVEGTPAVNDLPCTWLSRASSSAVRSLLLTILCHHQEVEQREKGGEEKEDSEAAVPIPGIPIDWGALRVIGDTYTMNDRDAICPYLYDSSLTCTAYHSDNARGGCYPTSPYPFLPTTRNNELEAQHKGVACWGHTRETPARIKEKSHITWVRPAEGKEALEVDRSNKYESPQDMDQQQPILQHKP
ncbi:hypothetical protein E2C01_024911 [Portunus trituberculatus]|uniref:Uncharacterized protein n=1 Tax=Portunus trituberculatus TaxID=210409 RepID=A0A5B7EE32_PORTR|nr:hypothetical protein [Portunus trituberculatus]